MKKCLFFITIINIDFLLVNLKKIVILSDKTIQGKEKIAKESFVNYNNISIVSNIQLKKDFFDIPSYYLIKMEFNTFSISIQNKYYYLLKFIISNYLNFSYFDRALAANNIYKSFFEVIFLYFNIINNPVFIDVNIYFFKSKNLLLNKGILIISKKYIIDIPNGFSHPFLIIYWQYISNFDKYLSHFYANIEKGILKEKNELLDILDELDNNFIKIISDIVGEYFELFEKSHKMKLENINFEEKQKY